MKIKLAIGAIISLTSLSAVNADALTPSRPVKINTSLSFYNVALECHPNTKEIGNTSIKNPTSATIPKGTTVKMKLKWADGKIEDKSYTLVSNLAPGAQTPTSHGTERIDYTCTAGFNAGPPDLEPKGVIKTSTGSIYAKVTNNNKWIKARSFTVRMALKDCSSHNVLKSQVAGPYSLAGGKSGYFKLPFTPGSKQYVEIIADYGKQVLESNETNNTKSYFINNCIL